jgi:hypothetical protein
VLFGSQQETCGDDVRVHGRKSQIKQERDIGFQGGAAREFPIHDLVSMRGVNHHFCGSSTGIESLA